MSYACVMDWQQILNVRRPHERSGFGFELEAWFLHCSATFQMQILSCYYSVNPPYWEWICCLDRNHNHYGFSSWSSISSTWCTEDHQHTRPSGLFSNTYSITLPYCLWWSQNYQQGCSRVSCPGAVVGVPHLYWYSGCSSQQRSA